MRVILGIILVLCGYVIVPRAIVRYEKAGLPKININKFKEIIKY
jgi:hypothetical protein